MNENQDTIEKVEVNVQSASATDIINILLKHQESVEQRVDARVSAHLQERNQIIDAVRESEDERRSALEAAKNEGKAEAEEEFNRREAEEEDIRQRRLQASTPNPPAVQALGWLAAIGIAVVWGFVTYYG